MSLPYPSVTRPDDFSNYWDWADGLTLWLCGGLAGENPISGMMVCQ